MNDPERQDLLCRLHDADNARRRWKVLALAGTPILAFLLIISASNAVTSWLALREIVKRERDLRDDVMQAEREARMRAMQKREEALRAAEEAQERAEKALNELPPAEKEP